MSASARVTLGEICEDISYGVTTSASFETTGPKLLRITDIVNRGVNWAQVPNCSISRSEEQLSLLSHGDIVIARTGGTVGKSLVVTNPPRAVSASYLLRLRPDQKKVLTEYLGLFLNSPVYWLQLLDAARGAAQPNVNATTLSKIQMCLPALAEQRLTTKRLKAQLTKVETARSRAECQLSELGKLANSIIRHSIEQKGNPPVHLGNILVEVKAGIGPSWSHYPVLGATREGLAPAKEPVGKKPERYKPAFPGTVFYNPMRILIGSIAFVDDDDEPGITSPDYVVLRGREQVVDSRWFYYWLRSPYGEQCISSLARGAVRERMLYNRLSEGTINLPPYSVQLRASEALKELKTMKYAVEKQLKEINLMPIRLLSQDFEILS